MFFICCIQQDTYQNQCQSSWLWWTLGNTGHKSPTKWMSKYKRRWCRRAFLSLGWTWAQSLVIRDWPVQCRVVSGIPAAQPWGDMSGTMSKLWKPKLCPDIARCPKKGALPPGGGGRPLAQGEILENWSVRQRGSLVHLRFQLASAVCQAWQQQRTYPATRKRVLGLLVYPCLWCSS